MTKDLTNLAFPDLARTRSFLAGFPGTEDQVDYIAKLEAADGRRGKSAYPAPRMDTLESRLLTNGVWLEPLWNFPTNTNALLSILVRLERLAAGFAWVDHRLEISQFQSHVIIAYSENTVRAVQAQVGLKEDFDRMVYRWSENYKPPAVFMLPVMDYDMQPEQMQAFLDMIGPLQPGRLEIFVPCEIGSGLRINRKAVQQTHVMTEREFNYCRRILGRNRDGWEIEQDPRQPQPLQQEANLMDHVFVRVNYVDPAIDYEGMRVYAAKGTKQDSISRAVREFKEGEPTCKITSMAFVDALDQDKIVEEINLEEINLDEIAA